MMHALYNSHESSYETSHQKVDSQSFKTLISCILDPSRFYSIFLFPVHGPEKSFMSAIYAILW
jgi:hypothetical protein